MFRKTDGMDRLFREPEVMYSILAGDFSKKNGPALLL